MFGLAIHSSTPELGLAISDFNAIHRYQGWALGRELSSQLHILLQGFLNPQSWQDLSFLAVCIGPGGFTGTRIGVATARTLAQQLDIPLFGISAMAAVAYHHVTKVEPAIPAQYIAVTMPAKRGAVYGGIYHWDGTTLTVKLKDTVLPGSDWEDKQSQWSEPLLNLFLESGVGLAKHTPSLLSLGHEQWQLGQYSDWREVVPFYGQHPVREIKGKK
ncbi:MAG: tRNA (adenosine(37)-N6)-threonylcarbamoyltransferase complex dimerization subunit type 1 TsaB [Leptolyngbyaceae cyanobacterium MAG.088]|nr:tRNA (adenosine(37)-N6)-threonylcarbamoyltransferase complex dimerization subunit type 1 TsaB [Leptolyngbyaceae cyanobacterium MAG.088]